MSAQRRKTFVLADTAQIFAFGWNGFESLGLPTESKALRPTQVAVGIILAKQHIGHVSAGFYHTACITREGLLVPFGDNESGQLGFDAGYPRWRFY